MMIYNIKYCNILSKTVYFFLLYENDSHVSLVSCNFYILCIIVNQRYFSFSLPLINLNKCSDDGNVCTNPNVP